MSTSYDFEKILRRTQEFIAGNYPQMLDNTVGYDKSREILGNRIRPFLRQQFPAALEESGDALVEKLYEYLAGYAFLAPYLRHPEKHLDVEEININRWNSITKKMSSGASVFMDQMFLSPQNAINVFQRIFSMKNVAWNESAPYAETSIAQNVRLAMFRWPRVPKEVGVMGSIRLIHEGSGIRYNFVPETLDADMYEFLRTLVVYKQSFGIGGIPGSGKTSLLNKLTKNVNGQNRVITVEENARELGGLDTFDEHGRLNNQVLPVIVNTGDDVSKVIYASLRMGYDYLIPQELRSDETYAALEAAYTGCIFTTLHIGAAGLAWDRIADLLRKKINYDKESLMNYAIRGLPVIAYMSKSPETPKPIRRVMEIIEGERYDSQHGLVYRTLYRYHVENTVHDTNGKCKVSGRFERVKGISPNLQHRLQNSYCPIDLIHKFADKEEWIL